MELRKLQATDLFIIVKIINTLGIKKIKVFYQKIRESRLGPRSLKMTKPSAATPGLSILRGIQDVTASELLMADYATAGFALDWRRQH